MNPSAIARALALAPAAQHTCDDGGFIYHPSCQACRALREGMNVTYCIYCSQRGTLSGRIRTREQIGALNLGSRAARGTALAAQTDTDALRAVCVSEQDCNARIDAEYRNRSYQGLRPQYHPGYAYVLSHLPGR
jgi:hypothetical protein